MSSHPATDSGERGRPGSDDFPQVFGKYVLLRPMAKGGMGELFLAAAGETGGFEKLCVVKKVLQDLDDDGVRRRFLDEAKVVVRLNHANLVQVFDAGRVGDEYYLAMELVEGKDLRAIWNRCAQLHRRIPVDFATFAVREMCRGLDYVHDAMRLDLVHRDISPPNILVGYRGEVKITDFGLAKHAIKRELTNPGVVFGRYSYLAPEQARGLPADRRTDIYAAGIVLWEMLTGRQLFPAEHKGKGAPLSELRNPVIRAPSELVPGIPDGLDAVVLKALAVEREDRYPTAGEFRAALSEIVAEHYPKCDVDRVGAFMHDIFARECKLEGQDYASFSREDFSPIRRLADPTQTLSISDIVVELEPPVASSMELRDSDIVELGASPIRAGWGEGPSHKSLEEAAATRVGQVVGRRYRVDRLLGVGGMGAVYEVTHVALGKTYALKVLHEVYGRDPDLIDRFMREARSASQTGHPNIIDVVDIGTMESGDVYFVMELLEGSALSGLIVAEGRLSVRRCVHIGRQICKALAAAHAAGIIHRDLKSENVMLTMRGQDPDFVKVLDFGICKQVDPSSSSQTTPGLVMGSPDYMAPEQAAGAPANAKSDIYALGTILFEMLAGRLPFVGRNAIDVLMQKGGREAPDVRDFCADVPESLAGLVARCLARDLERRPDSMRSVDYELTRAIEGRASAVAAAIGLSLEGEGRGGDGRASSSADPPPPAAAPPATGEAPAASPGRPASGPHPASSSTAARSSGVIDQAALSGAQYSLTRGERPTSGLVTGVKALLFVALGVALAGAVVFALGEGDTAMRERVAAEAASTSSAERAAAPASTNPRGSEPAPRRADALAGAPGAEPDPGTRSTGAEPDPGTRSTGAVPDPGAAGEGASALDPGTAVGDEAAPAIASEADPAELVRRAEAALVDEHWRDPPQGSLALELATLNVHDPGNEALRRLRRAAAKVLEPRGDRALARKQWTEAADAYRDLLAVWPEIDETGTEVRPDFATALRNRGRVLARHKDWEAALTTADELLNLDPELFIGLKLRADALAGLGRWEEAAPAYRAAMKQNKGSKDAKKGWYKARRMIEKRQH